MEQDGFQYIVYSLTYRLFLDPSTTNPRAFCKNAQLKTGEH